MQGIELEDVNHIPLAMNEFRALDNAKRKKLRDTKAGQWLRTSAPKVLEAVGDALPDSVVSISRWTSINHEMNRCI